MKKYNKEETTERNNSNNIPCEDKKIEEIEKLEREIKKVAPELSPEKTKKIVKKVTIFTRERIVHVGPLPLPEHFKKYEEILPGSAERILTMAENQSTHRQELEKCVIYSSTRNETLGVIFAFIIFMTTIGLGAWLLYNNKNVGGLATIASAVFGGVGVFIYGKKKQREELTSKRESLDNHRAKS